MKFRLAENIVYESEGGQPEGQRFENISKLKTLKQASRFLLFLNTEKDVKLNHQKNNDVYLKTQSKVTALKEILREVLQKENVKFIHKILDNNIEPNKITKPLKNLVPGVRKIKAVPFEEVGSSHFEELEALKEPENILPIAITNVVDNIPDELNELGIGEGNIFASDEKALLEEMIKNKLEESIFSDSEKERMNSVIKKYPTSWGVKQSNARMSLLNPIHVDLKPGYKILRSDGYHQSPEAEEFLELKFQALQEAGIVERSTNPLWGHPVFVVPKKMKVPADWLDRSEEEKEKWRKSNILNRFRMVSNMIRLNRITIPTSLNLPNLERQLLSLKDSKFYITLDVLSGFDFMPTDQESREIFTLVSRRSAWRMNGSPMGWCNTPALFFDRIINEIIDDNDERLFAREGDGVVAWLDDLLIYSRTFSMLIHMLEVLLRRAMTKRIRFNLRKCGFGEKHTVWCGREVRDGLWNFSPQFYDKIMNMPRPQYRHQAAQLVYLANWLSPNIPYLAALRKPFAHFANLGGKKLSQIEKEKELIDWTEELETAYIKLKEAIVESSKRFLTSYDHRKPLLLFTDSSADTWSLSLFQDEKENINNDVRALRPKPLMFLSGGFSNSELRWHIASKELYPIVYAFERIGFMLRIHAGGIYVYTDHKALLSIVKTKENEKRIYWDRLYRWILRLQAVDMVIFHISSRDNFVADLLTRWGRDQKLRLTRCSVKLNEDLTANRAKTDLYDLMDNSKQVIQEDSFDYTTLIDDENTYFTDLSTFSEEQTYITIKLRSLRTNAEDDVAKRKKQEDLNFKDVLEESVNTTIEELRTDLFNEHISFLSPFYPNSSWENINLKKIQKHQRQMDNAFKEKCTDKEGILYFRNQLVIPRTLLIRYLVTNHSLRGHPSKQAELKYLNEVYFEGIKKKDLKNLLTVFRGRCLHCQRGPRLLRRPLHLTKFANKARDLLGADYLYINSTGYILTLIDSVTRKVQLTYAERPSSEDMAIALEKWRADFGFSEVFTIATDNGSHFANSLLNELAKRIGFEQYFTVVYSPWTNGSTEVMNSSILRYLRSLVSQFGMQESEWPYLLPLITYILNNKPMESRGGRTANELFLYFKPKTSLYEKDLKFYSVRVKNHFYEPLDVQDLIQTVDSISSLLDDLQNKTYEVVKFKRELKNQERNKGYGLFVQYSPGDYILLAEEGTQNAQEKTKLSWLGPYQVIEVVSNNVYEVESITGKRRLVHGSRMWFYSHQKPLGGEKLKALFVHNFSALEVEKLISIRTSEGRRPEYQLRVRWLGFTSKSDTWESLESLYQDIPIMVRNFIEQKVEDESFKTHLLVQLGAIDKKKYQKKQNRRLKLNRMFTTRFHKIKNYELLPSGNTIGWFPQEKEVLNSLVMKFGSGNYAEYKQFPYLPYRSKQQMSTQIQKSINLQSFGIFHGLRFDLDQAREFLREHFGIQKFHRNLPGRFNTYSEKDQMIKLFKAEVVLETPPDEIQVPYFRRLEDPRHIKLMEAEFESEDCKRFLSAHGIHTIKQLKQLRLDYSQDVVDLFISSEAILDDFVSYIREHLDFWTTLSWIYSYSCSMEPYKAFYSNVKTIYTSHEEDKGTLSIKISSSDVVLISYWKDIEETKLLLEYTGGNTFKFASRNAFIYVEPPQSLLYLSDVFTLSLLKPRSKSSVFDLVLLDPPWKIGVGDPTRGVHLPYSTMSLKDFESLKLPLSNFPFGGFLFIWVTNSSYWAALKWCHSQHYFLIDSFTWIKMYPSTKLRKSIGYILQHSHETCLVFERRNDEEVEYTDIFNDIEENNISNMFITTPTEPSTKPEEFYLILSTLFPNANCLELFARHNNVRRNWTTCGLELLPEAHCLYTSIVPGSES
eukprot:snap_masked-scaffold_3-processed-gene-2.39-mRNA-1 protein AED:0.48 eAED:0.48 QI:0/-1/0/1/-1/1/1/0/1861